MRSRMLATLALLLLAPLAALAADARPWQADLSAELLKLIVAIVAAVAVRALTALRDKLDADKRLVSDELLRSVSQHAASWVEEKAAAMALDGYVFSGSDKLAAAVSEVVERVPGVSHDQAERAVRSALEWAGRGAAAKLRERRAAKGEAADVASAPDGDAAADANP